MSKKKGGNNNFLKEILGCDIGKIVLGESVNVVVSSLLGDKYFFWLITTVVLGILLISKCITCIQKKDFAKKMKSCKRIVVYIFVLSFWVVFGISGTYMKAAEFVENMVRSEEKGNGMEEKGIEGEEEEKEEKEEKKKTYTSQPPKTIPPNVNLEIDLSDMENIRDIETEIYNNVFFVGENISSDIECQSVVKERVGNLLKKKKLNQLEKRDNEAMNEIASQASLDEESLLNKQEECRQYRIKNDIDAWYENIPKASQVIDIIQNRCKLEPDYFNAELASMVSNNFLLLALEYIHQKRSGESILYYECMSIVYAQKCLEYKELKNKDINKMVKFIAARYKEIADCGLVEEDVRVRAGRIYRAYCDTFEV